MTKDARDPADALVLALDFTSGAEALGFCDRLAGRLRWVKVGLELFTAEGPAIVRQLRERDLQVFLDLKLHDIPNTVERAAARAAELGVSLLTIHAGGGEAMIAAAVHGAAAHGPATRILAVTVLTSLSGEELPGYYAPLPVPERVALLARAAKASGAHGVVASPQELRVLRSACGPDFVLRRPASASRTKQPGTRNGSPPPALRWRTAPTISCSAVRSRGRLIRSRPLTAPVLRSLPRSDAQALQ